jgi:hypothetical protein
MTITEEMIEAAAKAICVNDSGLTWAELYDADKDTYRRTARAALAAALPMMDGWQPIETAPNDGIRVLLWHSTWQAPSSGQWYGDKWSVGYDLSPFAMQPTHWRPLPPPPKGDGT